MILLNSMLVVLKTDLVGSADLHRAGPTVQLLHCRLEFVAEVPAESQTCEEVLRSLC